MEPRIGFQYLIEDSNDDEIDREARIIVADGLTTFGIDFGLGMNIAAFAGLRAGAVLENTLSQDETMALQAMAGVSLSLLSRGRAIQPRLQSRRGAKSKALVHPQATRSARASDVVNPGDLSKRLRSFSPPSSCPGA